MKFNIQRAYYNILSFTQSLSLSNIINTKLDCTMKKIHVLSILFLLYSFNGMCQKLSIAGQFGWTSPQGSAFESNGEPMAKGGINLDFDVLYHLEKFNNKLGVGINYNSSILFGASRTGFDIGLYGLALYGAKAHYKFFESKVTPYVALTTGLTRFVTPEISDANGQVLSESVKNSSFGFRPEVGLHLGGFFLAVGYVTPMKYKVIEEKAGALQFSLGVRIKAL